MYASTVVGSLWAERDKENGKSVYGPTGWAKQDEASFALLLRS
jgi:hypothetical protein